MNGEGGRERRYFGEIAKLVQVGAATPSDDYSGRNAGLYDLIERYTGDVPFYLRQSRAAAGAPVLELGCGTGRVLLPLARAGIQVTGIDLSPAMLDICRAKLAAEAPETAARATLVEGDMRQFALPCRFGLIICPLYTFIHLRTVADKLAMFQRVAEHLAPGGRLVLEAELAASFRETTSPVLNVVRHDRRSGDTLLVLQQGRREPGGGVLINLLNIAIAGDGAASMIAVSSLESRTSPEELADLATSAGLDVQAVWGDYDGGALAPDARGVVFVAQQPRG
jgi:SAM-dependent methyltransferase